MWMASVRSTGSSREPPLDADLILTILVPMPHARSAIRTEIAGQGPSGVGRACPMAELACQEPDIDTAGHHRNAESRGRLFLTLPAVADIDPVGRFREFVPHLAALAAAFEAICSFRHSQTLCLSPVATIPVLDRAAGLAVAKPGRHNEISVSRF
jgi:hypothetical protein